MGFFLSEDARSILKDRWLLWDTCALIRMVEDDADELIELLGSLSAGNITIKPVILELKATKDQRYAIKRAGFIERHSMTILRTNLETRNDNTEKIQNLLPAGSQPRAVDLMIASVMAQYNQHNKVLLVTENVKDFPEPLFPKLGFFMSTSSMRSSGLSLLGMDMALLNKAKN